MPIRRFCCEENAVGATIVPESPIRRALCDATLHVPNRELHPRAEHFFKALFRRLFVKPGKLRDCLNRRHYFRFTDLERWATSRTKSGRRCPCSKYVQTERVNRNRLNSVQVFPWRTSRLYREKFEVTDKTVLRALLARVFGGNYFLKFSENGVKKKLKNSRHKILTCERCSRWVVVAKWTR